jgi:predicted DNA-binding protein (UPF0251 family)
MSRPIHCRRVGSIPESNYFKPRGIPLSLLEDVVLTVDEFEAIRLADLENLYQEQAAEKMNVSRQTFGRIIDSAHKKVAEALVQGKALKIEGGEFEVTKMRKFKCYDCQHA